ncbi:MAG: Hsp70 family protein, partial [Bradymonadaceae bacterium]
MKIRRALGIDLGTTNSAIALFGADEHEILLHEDKFRRKTMPSMVGFNFETDELLTGFEAWNRRAMDPAPVASVKRKMGSQRPVSVGPHEMLPEEVSAKILERLVEDMRPFVSDRVEDVDYVLDQAVITVPAYFSDAQRTATRQAGELAGLKVERIINEPTAAALCYVGKHGIGDGTFLVYDLGGGTFDVSVIRCLLGEYQVLGIHGDNYLGGDDFDRRLAEYFRQFLVDQGYSLDLDVANESADAVRFLLLTRLAQEIKEALSTSEFQYVARRDIFEDKAGQSVTLELEISREQFEELIGDLVEQSVDCALKALELSTEAGDTRLEDVDYILLVGGSTRVPLVQRKIEEELCGPGKSKASRPLIDEPDTCVALGAAIHAGNVAPIELIAEDDDALRVQLTGSLGTSAPAARLSGRLLSDGAGSATTSAISSAVLVNPAGDIASIVRVDTDDGDIAFTFEAIPTTEVGRYDYRLELCDREGDALHSFPLWLRRLPDESANRPTGGALSNPSVLAKDIYLDVVRDGRQGRTLLLGR